MSQPAYFSHYGQEPPRRTGARHPSISPYGPYQTGDGKVFLAVQNDREWTVLCREVLQRPELTEDDRFRTNPDRVANHDELTAVIESVFARHPVEKIIEQLETAGIATAQLRTPDGFTRHPQLSARERWREVATPGGPVRALLPPVEVAGREPVMADVPSLGEHNEAIRAEFGAGVQQRKEP